ncbi:kelch-like protein 40 [Physella acuta]|uniref:kelch-like protein 40 n=1 Tax=Physella acuta TaxID=109671 RepID=UPI0027DCD3CB|nr:kelch-like protein 40 [Physella acuta]
MSHSEHKVDGLHVAKEVFKCFEKHKENFTDFTVNVGDTKFNCHKFVLSSCSGFFEALMRTDMREKSESSCTIECISPEIFGLLLDVIYKGSEVLDEENMLEMWHASNQLQIKFLVVDCENFVKERINLENYWEIFTNAKLLDSIDVTTRVKEFMVNNFSEILESNVFMQLSLDDLKFILNHKNFLFEADFSVQSVLKWTCSDDSYLAATPKKCLSSTDMVKTIFDRLKPSRSAVDVVTLDQDNITLRRSHFGELLIVLPLQDTTNACLAKLMNNRFVLSNFDAITLVNQIAATRFDAGETKSFNEKTNKNQTFKNGFIFNSDSTQSTENKPSKTTRDRVGRYCLYGAVLVMACMVAIVIYMIITSVFPTSCVFLQRSAVEYSQKIIPQ